MADAPVLLTPGCWIKLTDEKTQWSDPEGRTGERNEITSGEIILVIGKREEFINKDPSRQVVNVITSNGTRGWMWLVSDQFELVG